MDYSSIPDYSRGAANPTDVFTSPSSIGGYDWGTDTPFNNTYTPTIQQAPAQTNWLDNVNAISAFIDATGNAIRRAKGMEPVRGGPSDQLAERQAQAERDRRDRELISSLLDRYSKTDKESEKTDPENLLDRYRVLDPTKKMEVAGLTEIEGERRPSWTSIPRLAGDIFAGSSRRMF